jgi:phosphate transport system substrate-binding protein
VFKFFDWALKNGSKSAVELDYVPMPAATVSLIEAEWKKVTDVSGKAVF